MDSMKLLIIDNEVNLPPSILDSLLEGQSNNLEPKQSNNLEPKQSNNLELKQSNNLELKQLNNLKRYKPTNLELYTLLGCKNLYQYKDLCNAMNWFLSFAFMITNEYNKYIFSIGEYASLPHTHKNYNDYWLFTQNFLNNLHSMVKNKTDKNETQGFILQLLLNNTCADFQDALQKTINFNIVDYLSLGTPKNKFNLFQRHNINPIVNQNSIVKPNEIHSSIVRVFHNYLFPIINLISNHLTLL